MDLGTKVLFGELSRLIRSWEKGKANELVFEENQIPIGSKRTGKLIFEDEAENLSSKKLCIEASTPQPTFNEKSAMAAL